MAFVWTCPYCGHTQTVTKEKADVRQGVLDVGENVNGNAGYRITAIGCSNPECRRVQVTVEYGSTRRYADGTLLEYQQTITSRQILPDSAAKPQPTYVPIALRNDYIEACRIRDLSPKASATLARRCLQGMIRDYCKITKGRLVDEIDTLRKTVDSGTAPSGVTIESVEAIDHVRGVGNIGAHMEKDIDLIVDVDPGEAQALIELIELLFDEWYVARHVRQERLNRVKEIAEAKADAKKPSPKADATSS